MLDARFHLADHRTDARTELLAGLTTFVTMAYIIFVQPGMLSQAPVGMDFGAVTAATCIGAAIGSALMGLLARYPIALAPGMGINAFFAFVLVPAAAETGHPEPWRAALGVVFVAGLLFLVLTLVGVRERLMDAISPSQKSAIGAGIGLFIAFIGLENASLVVDHPATLVSLASDLGSPGVAVFGVGFAVAAVLHARGVPGGILIGLVASTATAGAFYAAGSGAHMPGFAPARDIVSAPPSIAPTFLAFDLWAVWGLLPFVLVFLFVDVLDTMGTLVGVAGPGGFLVDDRLPRAERALLADAAATVTGACLGTSTVTSYVESAAGVAQGGRTGLVSLTVAALFLLALFFAPLIAMVASYPPITAPALVLVGAIMMQSIGKVDWKDPTEWIPAFLVVAGIPLTFSIADGMAIGLIAYPVLKLGLGRGREVTPPLWVLAAALGLYLALLR